MTTPDPATTAARDAIEKYPPSRRVDPLLAARVAVNAARPVIAEQAAADERQRCREDIVTMLYAEAEHESANGRPLGSAALRRFAELLDGDSYD